jgi:hypothetical protein
MLKLKKNLIRPLTIFLTTTSVGCITAPTKPSLEICLLDVANQEVSCGTTHLDEVDSLKEATYNKVYSIIKKSNSAVRMPISYMEHGVCMRPMEYGKSQDYMHKLEIIVAQGQKCLSAHGVYKISPGPITDEKALNNTSPQE